MTAYRTATILFVLTALCVGVLTPHVALAIKPKDKAMIKRHQAFLDSMLEELQKHKEIIFANEAAAQADVVTNALQQTIKLGNAFVNYYPKVERDYAAAISWYSSKGASYKKGKRAVQSARKTARKTFSEFKKQAELIEKECLKLEKAGFMEFEKKEWDQFTSKMQRAQVSRF